MPFADVDLASTYFMQRLAQTRQAEQMTASMQFDLARSPMNDDELEEIIDSFRDSPRSKSGWGLSEALGEVLSRGSKTIPVDDLKALQLNLKAQGYAPPEADANGIWDPSWYAAFRRFDRDNFEKQRQGYHWYSAPVESGIRAITNTLPSRVFQGIVGGAKGAILQTPETFERGGALGGAVAGGAIGAAAGSFIPGVGTAIGAAGGAAIGGAAGFLMDLFGEDEGEEDQSGLAKVIDALSPYTEYKQQGPQAFWEDLGYVATAASLVSGAGMAAQGARTGLTTLRAARTTLPGVAAEGLPLGGAATQSVTAPFARGLGQAFEVAGPVQPASLARAALVPTRAAGQTELGAFGTILRAAKVGRRLRPGSPGWLDATMAKWSPTAFASRAGPNILLKEFQAASQANIGARMFGGIGQGGKGAFSEARDALKAELGRDLTEEEQLNLAKTTGISTIEKAIANAPRLETGIGVPLLGDAVDLAAIVLYPGRLLPWGGAQTAKAATSMLGDTALRPLIHAAQHENPSLSLGKARAWVKENISPVDNAWLRADFGINRMARDTVDVAFRGNTARATERRAMEHARADVIRKIRGEIEASGKSETLEKAMTFSFVDDVAFEGWLIGLNKESRGIDRLSNWKRANETARRLEREVQGNTRYVRKDGKIVGARADIKVPERYETFSTAEGPVKLPVREENVPIGGVARTGTGSKVDILSVESRVQQLERRQRMWKQAAKKTTDPWKKTQLDAQLRLLDSEVASLKRSATDLKRSVGHEVQPDRFRLVPARKDHATKQVIALKRREYLDLRQQVLNAKSPQTKVMAMQDMANWTDEAIAEGIIPERLASKAKRAEPTEEPAKYMEQWTKGASSEITLPPALQHYAQEMDALGYKLVESGDDVLFPDQLSQMVEISGVGDFTRRAAFWETLGLSPKFRADRSLFNVRRMAELTEVRKVLDKHDIKLSPEQAFRRLHEHLVSINHDGAVLGPLRKGKTGKIGLYKIDTRDLSPEEILMAFDDVPGFTPEVGKEFFGALRRGAAYGGELKLLHPADSMRVIGRAMRNNGLPGFADVVRSWHADVPMRLNRKAWRTSNFRYRPSSELARSPQRKRVEVALKHVAKETKVSHAQRQVGMFWLDVIAKGQVKAGRFASVDEFFSRLDVDFLSDYIAKDWEKGRILFKYGRELQPEDLARLSESTVVDVRNRPVRLYHGTPEVFDEFAPGFSHDRGTVGWFSDSPDLANEWSLSTIDFNVHSPEDVWRADEFQEMLEMGVTSGSPNVRTVYLDLKNPFSRDLDYTGHEATDILRAARRLADDPDEQALGAAGIVRDRLEEAYASKGYLDGSDLLPDETSVGYATRRVLEEAGYDGVRMKTDIHTGHYSAEHGGGVDEAADDLFSGSDIFGSSGEEFAGLGPQHEVFLPFRKDQIVQPRPTIQVRTHSEHVLGDKEAYTLYKRIRETPSHERLKELTLEFKDSREWYTNSSFEITDLFGDMGKVALRNGEDIEVAELMTQLIASTSPLRPVETNFMDALDVFNAYLKDPDGPYPSGMLDSVRGMVDDVLNGHGPAKWEQPHRMTMGTVDTTKKVPGRWYTTEANAEPMRLDRLKKHLEFDRAKEPLGTDIDELARDIGERGFDEALILEYDPKTQKALLIEGNHRVAAAEKLGLEHVPVRVVVKQHDASKEWLKKAKKISYKTERLIEPDETGYVKSTARPSEIFTAAVPASNRGRMKVHNFYWNLKNEQRLVTVDSWMADLFGFDAVSPTVYDEISAEVVRVADELGWEPAQVQASMWAAAKRDASERALAEAVEIEKAGGKAGDLRRYAQDVLDARSYAELINEPGISSRLTELFDNMNGYALMQRVQDEVLGLTAFPDGDELRAVMRFFRSADYGTLVHENAHLLRRLLSDADLEILENAYALRPTIPDDVARGLESFTPEELLPKAAKAYKAGSEEIRVKTLDTVTKGNGGSTWNPRTGEQHPGGAGFGSVATKAGDGGSISVADAEDPAKWRAALDEFIEQNADELQNPNVYVGTWNDKEGMIWFDVSEVRDIETAKKLGILRKQKAIFDMEKLEDVPTVPWTREAEERFAEDAERYFLGKIEPGHSRGVFDVLGEAVSNLWTSTRPMAVETNLVPRGVRKMLDDQFDVLQNVVPETRTLGAIKDVKSKQVLGGAAIGGALGATEGDSPDDILKGVLMGGVAGLGARQSLKYTYGYLPDALTRLNTALRYTLSYTFDLGRYSEQNMIAMAKYNLPPMLSPTKHIQAREWVSPFSNGTVRGDDAWNHAVRFWDELNGTSWFQNIDDLDRRMYQAGMLGFSPRNWEVAQAWQLYQRGMGTDAIVEAVSSIGRYGVGRTAAEKSANFVVFPFSFSKKLLATLGDFILQHPGRNLLLHEGLRRYHESEMDTAVNDFLDSKAPLLKELASVNNLYFGISPGRFFLQGLSDHRTGVGKASQLLASFFVPSGAATPLAEAAGNLGDLAIHAFTPVVISGESINRAGGIDSVEDVFRRYIPLVRELDQYFTGEGAAVPRQIRAVLEGGDPYHQFSQYQDGLRQIKNDLEPYALAMGYQSVDGLMASDLGAAFDAQLEQDKRELALENPSGFRMSQEFTNQDTLNVHALQDLSEKPDRSAAEDAILGIVEQQQTWSYMNEILGIDAGVLGSIVAQDVRQTAQRYANDPRFVELWNRFFLREYGPIRRVA